MFERVLNTSEFLGFDGARGFSNDMFEVNNRNTRARCEIYSKLTIKTLE